MAPSAEYGTLMEQLGAFLTRILLVLEHLLPAFPERRRPTNTMQTMVGQEDMVTKIETWFERPKVSRYNSTSTAALWSTLALTTECSYFTTGLPNLPMLKMLLNRRLNQRIQKRSGVAVVQVAEVLHLEAAKLENFVGWINGGRPGTEIIEWQCVV